MLKLTKKQQQTNLKNYILKPKTKENNSLKIETGPFLIHL